MMRAPRRLTVALALLAGVGATTAPAEQAETASFAHTAIRLDAAQRHAIGLTTAPAERRPLDKVIRTVGRFATDERTLTDVTLKVGGYIQELFVDYTGKAVRKGDPLFTLYSPDLVSAEEEYLLARQTQARLGRSEVPGALEGAAALVRASRERLRLWNLDDAQVRELERRGTPSFEQMIRSPASGVVLEKMAVRGMRIEPGMTLYKIADLSTLWVYADIYEYELPRVHEGQEATIAPSYDPTRTFTARVAYVAPVLDPKTRTAKVRFEVPNSPDSALRPEAYGTVELRVPLGERLVVPETAVLDAGRRQTVFVDGGDGQLRPREVRLGVRADGWAEVLDGVAAGERVVTSANFLVDSESKLQATESMMGMMGALGMGDMKMESARPMDMGGESAAPQPEAKRVGDLLVSVLPAQEPATVGANTIRVRLTDTGGAPVTGATVGFNYTMDMPGMTIEETGTKDLGNGRYEGAAKFTMGGPWGLVVQIDRPGKPTLREKFTLRVGP